MSNVKSIRTDIAIDVKAMDTALNAQCCALFEAMGIVRLAARQAQRCSEAGGREVSHRGESIDVWTALDGAHKLLNRIADRLESSETMLAGEVSHGEY